MLRDTIWLAVLATASLVHPASAQADGLPTLPSDARICEADPATGERAVIIPPRYETISVSHSPLYPTTEWIVVPAILGPDGAVEREPRVGERVIPYTGHFPLQRREAEPARAGRLSDFAVGEEFVSRETETHETPPSWDGHLQDYRIRVEAEQYGAAAPLRFDGEPVLTPRVFKLEIGDDAPAGTPVRVVAGPRVITQESEADAVEAYHAAAREWAASLPERLVCKGHTVMSRPPELGPMPQRSFAKIGVRRVTSRREGSIQFYDRTGARMSP